MDRRLVNSRLADEFWAASANARYGEVRRIDVDKLIAALRRSIRRAVRTYLHASVVVLDEALQFLIHHLRRRCWNTREAQKPSPLRPWFRG